LFGKKAETPRPELELDEILERNVDSPLVGHIDLAQATATCFTTSETT
jgi:hypothetical protein